MSLDSVLTEVNAERLRQDKKWGGPANDDAKPFRFWFEHLHDWTSWARAMFGCGGRGRKECRRRLIQVAALAVAAVESLDRTYPPDETDS